MTAYATAEQFRNILQQVRRFTWQRITLGGASGGTLTLGHDGQTTGSIAYNALAATVKTVLEALSNIEADNLTVEGPAGGPWEITGSPLLAPLVLTSSLTGPGAITITVEDTDDLIDDELAAATAIVNTELTFSFADWPAPDTKKVRGSYQPVLTLPAHKQGSISAITLNGSPVTDWEELDNGQLYRVDNTGSEGTWGSGRYVITGIWGYGPVPDDIIEITLQIAVNLWQSNQAGSFAENVGMRGEGERPRNDFLTTMQRAIINRHKATYGKLDTPRALVGLLPPTRPVQVE